VNIVFDIAMLLGAASNVGHDYLPPRYGRSPGYGPES